MPREDARRHYEGYSNGILWPLFHYLLDRISFDSRDFEAYRRVSAQLRPIRRVEAVLHNTGLDIALEIERLRSEGGSGELAAALYEYHAGRFALSSALEKVMRQSV